MKKIKPLGNRIVVQRQEITASKGGILLPESAQEKPKQGKVVAVGPGKVDEKGHKHTVEVKVGDRVLFSSYGGTEYKVNEEDFLILSEEDVLAVLN
ncbi:MAG: co-chaperone GroES [Verrucomicrobiota bacterium]|nr:co-chaperone GroES [Verrucomicrobiota bacterium]